MKRILASTLALTVVSLLALSGCSSKRESSTAEAEPIASPRPRPVVVKRFAARSAAPGSPSVEKRLYKRELMEEDRFRNEFDTEAYDHIEENSFLVAKINPLSTFSIDVDTASYTNVRRILNEGRRPPAGAVRVEELINYFRFDYPQPEGEAPFSVDVEIAEAPWNREHRLARIGLKGFEIPDHARPPSNLVFLLDVSGSMNSPDKLPLVKSAMKMLTERLTGRDQVSIVVYAGAAGLVLPPTDGNDREAILSAIGRLEAGGSTAGGDGIQLAYQVAREQFLTGGINRVILASDGDFNVGITNQSDLVRLIEDEARDGTFLTVLGFGRGNLKDSTMEKLADHGNGNYAYIDNRAEARRVLVEQAGGTLVTIAKDVKIQVEFNPAHVQAYRLIGYENRMLRAEDFNDDRKDAGEIGAGHTVTALYEIVPPGVEIELPTVDELRYSRPADQPDLIAGSPDEAELFLLKLRYKQPDGESSRLLSFPVRDEGMTLAAASDDFRFASAVAAFGMILRGSEHHADFTFDETARLAMSGVGRDPRGSRSGFVELVLRAEDLGDG